MPDLCADRIDYSLRTLVIFNEINEEEKNYFLENLTITENDWTFKNFSSAKKFAEFFLMLNKVYYSGLTSAAMFQAVGNCLKYALEKQCVSEDDLYTTDDQVVEKIKKYLGKDGKLDLLWKRMSNKAEYKNNPNDYDGHIFVKSRIIDPLFLENIVLKRLSDVDDNWKDFKTRISSERIFCEV